MNPGLIFSIKTFEITYAKHTEFLDIVDFFEDRATPWEFREGCVANLVCRLDSFKTDLKLPRKDFADWRNISCQFADWDFPGGCHTPNTPNVGTALVENASLVFICFIYMFLMMI